jgi:hypothetical protein
MQIDRRACSVGRAAGLTRCGVFFLSSTCVYGEEMVGALEVM